MGLIRFIVIALIIYLLIQFAKRWLANKNAQNKNSLEENNMVRCQVCQLHVPENEAFTKEGQYFCSQKHLDGHQD
ncbi:MAG: PP0621 family protein [Woeseiaceae bacterium]